MALKKQIELKNGVIVNYHRIVSINKVTNHVNIIEVASYISETKRQEEIQKLANNEPMNIFINTNYISVDYEEAKNIKDYYEYLKTTEKFKDAENA